MRLAATSNTLPGKLGEGRFATDGLPARDPGAVGALRVACASTARTTGTADCPRRRPRRTPEHGDGGSPSATGASLDHFVDLARHLARGAPLQVRRPARRGAPVCLEDVRTVDDQAVGAAAGGARGPDVRPRPAVVASGVTFDAAVRAELLRAATARSTSARSAGWWRWPARARTSGLNRRQWAHCCHGEVDEQPTTTEALTVPRGPVDLSRTTRTATAGLQRRQEEGQGRALRARRGALRPPGAAVRRGHDRRPRAGCCWCCRAWTPPARAASSAHAVGLVDPQGVQHHVVQGADRRGAAPRLPLADRAGRCPSPG